MIDKSEQHNTTTTSSPSISKPTTTASSTPTSDYGDKSPKQTDDANPMGLPLTSRHTSTTWTHFTRKRVGKEIKVECNYCNKQLTGGPRSGTSHLTEHANKCVKRKCLDIRQTRLFGTQAKDGGSNDTLSLAPYELHQDKGRKDLAEMIILHEYPLTIVEHYGFRKYSKTLQPGFKVTCRNTTKKDIMQRYETEKEGISALLRKTNSRIALTTDMWTSSIKEMDTWLSPHTLLTMDGNSKVEHLGFCMSRHLTRLRKMVLVMLEKYNKYWADVNGLMGVATILDPRFKLKLIRFYFEKNYESFTVQAEIDRIEGLLHDLVDEYGSRNGKNQASKSKTKYVGFFNTKGKGTMLNEFAEFVEQNNTAISEKYDLDRYLETVNIPFVDDFDILNWWKTNGNNYPTLQQIAKDILSIPVSTVPSESAFSTSGRVIGPYRSRLLPETIEALMCAHNWLWADIKGSGEFKLERSQLEEIENDDCNTGVSDVTIGYGDGGGGIRTRPVRLPSLVVKYIRRDQNVIADRFAISGGGSPIGSTVSWIHCFMDPRLGGPPVDIKMAMGLLMEQRCRNWIERGEIDKGSFHWMLQLLSCSKKRKLEIMKETEVWKPYYRCNKVRKWLKKDQPTRQRLVALTGMLNGQVEKKIPSWKSTGVFDRGKGEEGRFTSFKKRSRKSFLYCGRKLKEDFVVRAADLISFKIGKKVLATVKRGIMRSNYGKISQGPDCIEEDRYEDICLGPLNSRILAKANCKDRGNDRERDNLLLSFRVNPSRYQSSNRGKVSTDQGFIKEERITGTRNRSRKSFKYYRRKKKSNIGKLFRGKVDLRKEGQWCSYKEVNFTLLAEPIHTMMGTKGIKEGIIGGRWGIDVTAGTFLAAPAVFKEAIEAVACYTNVEIIVRYRLHFTGEESEEIETPRVISEEDLVIMDHWVVAKLISYKKADCEVILKVFRSIWGSGRLEDSIILRENMFLFQFKSLDDKLAIMRRTTWSFNGNIIHKLPLGLMRKITTIKNDNKLGQTIAVDIWSGEGKMRDYLRVRPRYVKMGKMASQGGAFSSMNIFHHFSIGVESLATFSFNPQDKLEIAPFQVHGVLRMKRLGRQKKKLEIIANLASSSSLPWCMRVDFNEILHAYKNEGGRRWANVHMNGFQSCLWDADLWDIRPREGWFTWSGGTNTRTFVTEHINRFVATNVCRLMFPDYSVTTILTSFLNHCALFLFLESVDASRPPRIDYFKFDVCWVKEEQCTDIVRSIWENRDDLFLCKVKKAGDKLGRWQRTRRSQMKRDKRRLRDRILQLDSAPISDLVCEQHCQAMAELKEIIDKDEAYWL
ncbi:hypothetical protein F3Y22_tig00116989pilonHSYRG00276 [Hibiscus syriacus]|uniref:BED-type domain-containing protein n=1 Tax=Hibiscus syriacus TaxID=106335 RepID=A0A6A2WFM0_HIBSY|nr:hypothetical protein F3Y22_tig00116989pilonHSYRG00276 [Hibiscus syriacus]